MLILAERLAPCMQECDDPDLGTKMLAVGSDNTQGVAFAPSLGPVAFGGSPLNRMMS